MKELVINYYFFALLLIFGPIVISQQVSSNYFTSDQVTLWHGNTIVPHQSIVPSYQFTYTIQQAPSQINNIQAALTGLSISNGNTINFLVSILYVPSANGTFIIDFNPMNTSIYYSISFSLIALTALPNNFIHSHLQNLNILNLNNIARPVGSNSQSFTITSPLQFTHLAFEVRVFINCFHVVYGSGEVGISTNGQGVPTLNAFTFTFVIGVNPGVVVNACYVVVLIADITQLHAQRHMYFVADNFQISDNYFINPNIALSTHTSSNFGISPLFGPIFSRNCTIALYNIHFVADISIKTLLYDYNSAFGFINVQSIGGGGLLAYYQTFCVIDCTQTAFYYSVTNKCQFCSNYITYCETCLNENICTNCGINTFFDPLYRLCHCVIGIRVIGGCTDIVGCTSINPSNKCLHCSTGYTLSSNNRSCLCSTGYTMVTGICINVLGCIAAVNLHNSTRCLTCNQSMNMMMDFNRSNCVCRDGYSFKNGMCVTICGNGFLFLQEQCDDGNNQDGDGCSSLCEIETHYECVNSNSGSLSVCSYKSEDATISLIQVYRDNQQNAGYFVFQIVPAILNFNKMDFTSAVTFGCASNFTQPEVYYKDGILKIKIIFLQDIQDKLANVTINFNQTIFKHSPISDIFIIKSMNSPLRIFKKFPQYEFFKSFFTGISFVALLLFFLGSLAHKMIGIETIHVFQMLFFLCIYQVCYADLFLSSVQTLRYTSNYSDIFFDQLKGMDESGIYQSLRFAFTFIQNYYVVGSAQLIVFILLLTNFIYYKLKSDKQASQTTQQQIKQMNRSYKIRRDIMTSVLMVPLVLGYFYQCLFGVQAQNFRKLSNKQHFVYIVNSLLLVGFVFLSAFYLINQIVANLKNSGLNKHYQIKQRYILIYIFNFLVNLMILNISQFIQWDIIILLVWNILYFAVLIIYKPYVHNLHNFSIAFNNFVVIYWMGVLLYQDLSKNGLSEDQKFIVLTILQSLLAIVCLLSLVRILLQIVENGTQVHKINQYYDEIDLNYRRIFKRSREVRRKQRKQLNNDLQNINRYRLKAQEDIQKRQEENKINCERVGKNLSILFPKRHLRHGLKQNKSKQLIQQDNQQHLESYKTKKDQQIQKLKLKLREDLVRYRQKLLSND